MDAFLVLDMPSQSAAIQRLLGGLPAAEKLAWLRLRGRRAAVPPTAHGAQPVYVFESFVGLRCLFFIASDGFVFLGDHTTFTVRG